MKWILTKFQLQALQLQSSSMKSPRFECDSVNFANPFKNGIFFFSFDYRGAEQQERKIKMNPEKRHTSFGQTKKKKIIYLYLKIQCWERERERKRERERDGEMLRRPKGLTKMSQKVRITPEGSSYSRGLISVCVVNYVIQAAGWDPWISLFDGTCKIQFDIFSLLISPIFRNI